MTGPDWDVVVIGGGMAGASLAAELASTHRVVVLEAESQPGYHSTGRSVAIFSETYGGPQVRALSRASRPYLNGQDPRCPSAPVLTPRGSLYIARADQLSRLDDMAASADIGALVQRVTAQEAQAICPILAPGYVAAAMYEQDAREIDVHELHQQFLQRLRRAGGVLRLDAQVRAIARAGGGWRVSVDDESFTASVVVNAAGAWADGIARMAGLHPLGVTPLRRSVALAEGADPSALPDMPLTIDIDETFYFRVERGSLLISPADETPVAPGDAHPDEYDIAVGIDRVEQATTFRTRRVRSRWAGLRSFAPDRTPVIGFGEAGFFWLAGQGGYGIQTAPAAAALAASLIRDGGVPPALGDAGVEAAPLSPRRFDA